MGKALCETCKGLGCPECGCSGFVHAAPAVLSGEQLSASQFRDFHNGAFPELVYDGRSKPPRLVFGNCALTDHQRNHVIRMMFGTPVLSEDNLKKPCTWEVSPNDESKLPGFPVKLPGSDAVQGVFPKCDRDTGILSNPSGQQGNG